jgi:DNA primase large subunit
MSELLRVDNIKKEILRNGLIKYHVSEVKTSLHHNENSDHLSPVKIQKSKPQSMLVTPLESKIEISYSEATNVNISVESVSEEDDSILSAEIEDEAIFESLYEAEMTAGSSNKGSTGYLKFRKLCP